MHSEAVSPKKELLPTELNTTVVKIMRAHCQNKFSLPTFILLLHATKKMLYETLL
jgi:hypothetical protein